MVEIIKEDIISVGIIGTIVGGLFLVVYTLSGGWGSRGVDNYYSFRFKNENAYVKHDDVKWCPDKYWAELANGSKIKEGIIISDDNKKISLTGGNLAPTIEDVVATK